MKRVVALVAVLALVLVSVASAVWIFTQGDDASGTLGDPASSAPAQETPSDDTPSPDQGASQQAPDPALQEFYDQDLQWEQCGTRECARIEVPLDYDDPGGETIELALLKHAAADQGNKVGSLVVNPGGPGAPGTSYADQARYAFGEPLRERFDIIGFDPRGTGTSAAVDCLTDDELDDYIATDPAPDTPAEVKDLRQWSQRMGQGCAEKSGDLAAHVSTVEAARDMDVIRAVLGEDKLTYFGASYGTKLGATYADLFPDKSGRLVLDGAVDVSLSSRQLSLQQAAGFQTAIEAYVDHCLEGGDCYLGDSQDEALTTITDFLDDVDKEPIQVGDRELAVGNAFYGIVAPLYNDDYWMLLDNALSQALEGSGSGLLQLSDLYSSRNPGGGYSDNSSEAIWAINCLDDPYFAPVKKIPGQFDDFEEASPTFGKVFAWGLAGCEGLAVEPAEERPPLTAAGADPLLVIGTTRDPATPYKWAVALAEQLEPAILVKRDGDGHTGYNMGNACVDDVVESYLIDGEVPDGDVDCPA